MQVLFPNVNKKLEYDGTHKMQSELDLEGGYLTIGAKESSE